MTNDDVLGDSIPLDQQEALRQFCYQALKLGTGVGPSEASLLFLCWVSFTLTISPSFLAIILEIQLWYKFNKYHFDNEV